MVTTAVTAKSTTTVYCNTEMNNLFNEAGLLFNGNVLIRSNNVIVMFNNMRLKKNMTEPRHEISNNLASVDSDEPLQPPFKLRNSKWCSVSSLTIIEYSSDQQRL